MLNLMVLIKVTCRSESGGIIVPIETGRDAAVGQVPLNNLVNIT